MMLFKVFHQYKEQLKTQRCKPVGLKYRAPEQIKEIKQYKWMGIKQKKEG